MPRLEGRFGNRKILGRRQAGGSRENGPARGRAVVRRPVVRFAVLLWLAGALLLAWNVRLYSGHWRGTAENRRLLSQAQERLETARQSGLDQLQEIAELLAPTIDFRRPRRARLVALSTGGAADGERAMAIPYAAPSPEAGERSTLRTM